MAKKKKVDKLLARLKLVARFLIIFNLLSVPLYLTIYANFSWQPLQNFIAAISSWILQGMNYSLTVSENLIFITHGDLLLRFDVSWDSTGWKSLYALSALAIATPVAGRKKIRFLAVALPVIFVVNILRIVTTIAASLQYGFQYFDLLHTLLWREGLIIAVVALWAMWAYKQKYNIR